MTASFPFAEMTAQAGPFKGVDRQGCVFLIVRLGEVGKLPLCAYWTSREGVRSSLLGDGGMLLSVERDAHNADRVVFRMSGNTPELDADRKAEREYTVLGKRRLTDADWTDVTDDNILGFEFFKVRVRMK